MKENNLGYKKNISAEALDASYTTVKGKRDVLSEFSKLDSYTREKNIKFNAINEEDTEMMTAARRRVSKSDIQKRGTPQARHQSIAPERKAPIQERRTAAPQRIQQAQKKPQERGQDMRVPQKAHPQERAIPAEWTSVRASSAQSNTPKRQSAPPPPRRQEKETKAAPIKGKRNSESSLSPAQRRKRFFTPVDAELVIMRDPIPKKHRISPFTGIYIAASLLLAIITVILCISASTKITKIVVKTDDTASLNSQIEQICEKFVGKSYLTFNKDKAIKGIKEISALIADVKLEGKYPRKLVVSVVYDTPRYYASDEQGKCYVMSAELKVLQIYNFDESFDASTLTKLALPRFSVEKIGQTVKFESNANYVKKITQALADYHGLGHISYVSFANTQRIYFIFEGNFRCDLGNSDEIELKLKSAENIYQQSVLPALGTSSDRTAVINVSVPSSATCRLDAELGITE